MFDATGKEVNDTRANALVSRFYSWLATQRRTRGAFTIASTLQDAFDTCVGQRGMCQARTPTTGHKPRPTRHIHRIDGSTRCKAQHTPHCPPRLLRWLATQTMDSATQQLVLQTMNSAIVQEYAADLRNLSALWYDNDEAFDGNDAVWRDGYSSVRQPDAVNTSQTRLVRWKCTRHSGATTAMSRS